MIVKDEAPRLPACLESVRGLVDRVVVVDTGSQDDTVAEAQRLGATVLHHPWSADFAAARNHGLAAMAPGWMLVLDADELLAPGAAPVIRQAIAAGGFDAGLLPLHNATDAQAPARDVLSGASRLGEATHIARLFRLHPDLCWEGALHERLRSRQGRALRNREIAAPILHHGYADSAMARGQKLARNLAILRGMVAKGGPDPLPWIYLARASARAGDREGARWASDGAWSRLEAWVESGAPAPSGCFTLAALRADLMLQAGEAQAALDTIQRAGRWGGHPNLDLMAARAQLVLAAAAEGEVRRRLLAGATEAARRARQAHGKPQTDELSAGATSWAAAELLGLAQLMAGDPAARDSFERTLSELPRPATGLAQQAQTQAQLGLAELQLTSDPKGALTAIEPLLVLPWPDPWAVAAAACRALGRPEDAALFGAQARARRAAGWLSAHRSRLP